MRLRRFARLPQLIPALITLGEAEEQGWGRLLHVSARGLTLLTRMHIHRGREIFLSFDLGGAELTGIGCRVAQVKTDPDGYFNYGLALLKEGDARRIKDRLMELLAKNG